MIETKDFKIHLESAITQSNNLVQEINQLNTVVNTKKEQLFKLQGVVDYLSELGVTLDDGPDNYQENIEEVNKDLKINLD